MTYCLGLLMSDGFILASDSRSNAGIDHVNTVPKMNVFHEPGKRLIGITGAGNLGTTQSVVNRLSQALRTGTQGIDLFSAHTMFDAAQMVGDMLRVIMDRDANYVRPFGDPTGTFIVAGQIGEERPRVFQVYSAGNFVEATPRTPFVQIGEAKYGKPIIDRAFDYEMKMEPAVKIALLSFDATIRSNLSVAPPIDLLCYRAGTLSPEHRFKLKADDPYMSELRKGYGDGIMKLVHGLADPPWASGF